MLARPGFQSRFSWVPSPVDPVRFPMIHSLHKLFESPEMRHWAQCLLETEVELERVTTMGTLYQPGDYTTTHSDTINSGDGSRRLAFVLHLSTDWQPEWGGELIFLSPYLALTPSYNRLTLFPVGDMRHQHLVSPVSRFAPRGRRLAFVGWFYSMEDELAQERETLLSHNTETLDRYVLTINGKDGRSFHGPFD